MGRRVLVTGGAGFLGSRIAAALSDAGWEVRVLDVNPPSEGLPDDRRFIRGDIRDARVMQAAADGCDVVVDNAALVPVSKATPAEFRSVNVDGCRTTIEAARRAGAYVVHVSSSSIYGRPRDLPVTEDSPLRPFEPYGASKADAERIVQAERDRGLVVSSLRSRALLGRGRLGLFELIFARIRAGKRVPMFGRGTNRLQMCDARDFAAAVLAAIERRANGDYNIGATEFRTVREDLASLIERVGSSSRLMPVPAWTIRGVLRAADAFGLSPFTMWHLVAPSTAFYADVTRASRDLGWEPRFSNVDALEHAYGEYVEGVAGTSPHSAPLRGIVARLLRGDR